MEIDKKTVHFDYETFDGFYVIERNYFCKTKERRTFERIEPDAIINLIEAAKRVSKSQIVRTAPFASYSEALSDLDDALAALEL